MMLHSLLDRAIDRSATEGFHLIQSSDPKSLHVWSGGTGGLGGRWGGLSEDTHRLAHQWTDDAGILLRPHGLLYLPPLVWQNVFVRQSINVETVVMMPEVDGEPNPLSRAGGALSPAAETAPLASASDAPSKHPYGEAVREILGLTGLTRQEVGDLLGVRRQTIHRWLRGEKIASDNRHHLLAVRDVLRLAAQRHPSREAFQAWLTSPRGRDGRSAAQALAAGEIDRVRLLAVTSTPRPRGESRLPRAQGEPMWLREAPPDPWSARVEERRSRLYRADYEDDFLDDPPLLLLAEMNPEDADLDGK
jgi:transcriptional regulator with XRE-family HTH domain